MGKSREYDTTSLNNVDVWRNRVPELGRFDGETVCTKKMEFVMRENLLKALR